MPGITPNYQQHRQVAGNHSRWLDKHQPDQQEFACRVHALAKNPGAHSGNQGRQERALAMLQLITLLSAVSNNDPQPVISAAKADASPFGEPLALAENVQSSSISGFSTLYNKVSGALEHVGKFIVDNDPLTFPGVDARSAQAQQPAPAVQFVGKNKDERIVIEDIYGTVIELSRDYYDVANKTEPYQFIKEGTDALKEFYENYYAQHPNLKEMARKTVKNYIKKNFGLNINPDKFYFMHFNSIEYIDYKKLQFAPADIIRSLTQCLFTNFGAWIQDRMPDMDAMCGIYRESMINNTEFDADKALGVTPTQFINAVWYINFYKQATNAINKFFANEDMHIKKLFLDFIDHLNIAKLPEDAARDVLNGVNLFNDREIEGSFFDIDGYHSPNSFHFNNIKTGRHTLYFPHSDFKFKSFDNDILMRTWVTDACSDKKFRDMLEKHFTLYDRQDGSIYSGVDTWVNAIAQNHRYYDKIARKSEFIDSKNFFRTRVAKLKEKMLSDADTLIKSDSEVTRDLFEAGFEAANELFFDPFTGIVSLAFHIEHAAEGDTPEERKAEWVKLRSDAVNIATLVAFASFVKLPGIEGYEFIDSVKTDINVEAERRLVKFSEMEEVYAPGELESFDKNEMIDALLLHNNPEIAEDAASLDDLLPTNDQISLPGAEEGPAQAPPVDERDPFKHIPQPHDPFTLDEIQELDEIQPFVKESARAGNNPLSGAGRSQQAGAAAISWSGGRRVAIPPTSGASSLMRPVISTQTLPYIRSFVPYREIPLIKNWASFDYTLSQFITEKLRNHPWDLFLGFSEGEQEFVPQYMRVARSVVRMHIKSAEDAITKTRRVLLNPDMHDDVHFYFRNILGIADDRIIFEAVDRFRLQIQRISNFLYDTEQSGYNNFVIISTRQEIVDNPIFGFNHQYRSSIHDNNYLRTLSKAFIAKGDPHRRIFIMYDTIPEFDITGVDAFGRRKNNMESTILHEISHLAADTKDFYPNEINPQTFELGTARYMSEKFQHLLNNGALAYQNDFNIFTNAVSECFMLPYTNNDIAMLNLMRQNPMLQANFMMENADNFVAYVKDISEMHPPITKKIKKIKKKKNWGGKSSQSSDSKPGTSDSGVSHQMLKRAIREPEFDITEKFNGITFTAPREHYMANNTHKARSNRSGPEKKRLSYT
ncbi:dermonecrotic toxin domain-containing protein [Vagococcus sp. WN89Y]|uniref:dermonecrotic toxin domain-containing protein n=1 Tax=Vagococcus sp. WN89Y TaxID=3457258 RepID=UPI003FCDACDF